MRGVLLTVVAPMYNEKGNVAGTIQQIEETLGELEGKWELLIVDDGSTDGSAEEVRRVASDKPHIKLISYTPNRGRGYALRRGFREASGEFVVTMDFDLSYDPSHILRMVEVLKSEPSVDIVLASAYGPGGRVEGVPASRLIPSRLGNFLLRYALPKKIYTSTCVVRGYRAEALKKLELSSERKEIHLEILRKALALGMQIKEIPAHLRWKARRRRVRGLGLIALSHLMFSFFEKPGLLFGILGVALLLVGVILGLYATYIKITSELVSRPLLYLIVILVVCGIQMFSFWFLASQITALRNELYLVQKENLELRQKLEKKDEGGGD